MGFRWTGRGADDCTKSPKPPPDPSRGEHGRIARPLPGKSQVFDDASGQSQLGESGGYKPAPAVGLLGRAECRRGPAEGVLCEPGHVLDVKSKRPW